MYNKYMKEPFFEKTKKEAGLDLRELSAVVEDVGFYPLAGAIMRKEGAIKVLEYGDIKGVAFEVKKRSNIAPNESDKEMLVKMLGGQGTEIALLNPATMSSNFSYEYKEIEDFLVKNLIEQKLCNYVAIVTKSDKFGTTLQAEVVSHQKGIEDPLLEEGDVVVVSESGANYTEEAWRKKLSEKKFSEIKEKRERDEKDIEKRQRKSRISAEMY